MERAAAARLPEVRAGRSAITTYYRKDLGAVSEGIEDRKTDTGYACTRLRAKTNAPAADTSVKATMVASEIHAALASLA